MTFSYFSPELIPSAWHFEMAMWILLIGVLWYGVSHYRFFLWRFFALAFWVFCFEWLTWALWNNAHLGNYAYIHNDVSWVLTLTWSICIFIAKFSYDKSIQYKTLLKEFLIVTLGSSVLMSLVLMFLRDIGGILILFSSATTSSEWCADIWKTTWGNCIYSSFYFHRIFVLQILGTCHVW